MKYARITAETLSTATRVSSDFPTLAAIPLKADTSKKSTAFTKKTIGD